MEDINSEQLKRDLSFDVYGRFAIIGDIINVNRDNRDRYRILDVGGRGNLLKKFLPKDEVFYLDPNVESDDDNYIEGDGCAIPSEDSSFDFVVSTDVYEHIPPPKRELFLTENLRVARLGVILVAPFYSKERELAEKYANDNYRVISKGDDHVWLKEHIENGLPDKDEVEKYLRSNDYSFQVMYNNDLWLWEHLVCSSYLFLVADKAEKLKELNLFYNEKLYPQDHAENSYRTVYFIKKETDLKDLVLSEGGIDTSLHLEAIRNNFSLLSEVYLEEHALIETLILEGQQKQDVIVEMRKELAELQSIRKEELQSIRKEIDGIVTSYSWRLTRPARVIGRAVQNIIKSVKKT